MTVQEFIKDAIENHFAYLGEDFSEEFHQSVYQVLDISNHLKCSDIKPEVKQ